MSVNLITLAQERQRIQNTNPQPPPRNELTPNTQTPEERKQEILEYRDKTKLTEKQRWRQITAGEFQRYTFTFNGLIFNLIPK